MVTEYITLSAAQRIVLAVFLLIVQSTVAYSQSILTGGPTCKGEIYPLVFDGPGTGTWGNCQWKIDGETVPGTSTMLLTVFTRAGNIPVSCSCLDPNYPIYDNAGNLVSRGIRLGDNTAVPVYGANTPQLTVISSCDNNATGTIRADYLGTIVRWERSYDNVNWIPIASKQNPYPYVESQPTQFRVVVTGHDCGEMISPPVAIDYKTTMPGTIVTSGINYSCMQASGVLSIAGNNGAVLYWESSTDGISFAKISGSDNAPSIQVNVTERVKFRAQVQYSSCAARPTPVADIGPNNPVGGILTSSAPPMINCLNSTVTLELQSQSYRGDEFTWEQSQDGVNFTEHATATGLINTFNLTSQAYFRVKVGYSTNSCNDAYSSVYRVTVKSEGGTPSASPQAQCRTNSGLISLVNEAGAVTHWEHSIDGTEWSVVSNSSGKDPLPFTVTHPLSYFKALVQLDACQPEYSAIVTVRADQASLGGKIRFVGEEKAAETINGVLTFYPAFRLQDQLGTVKNWWRYDGYDSYIINNTTVEYKPIVTATTGYRAQVKNGACDAILSGQATFVVNKLYAGRIEVLDKKIITSYEGNSYSVKSHEGMSIQSGFSFHANTAQEFFVLLDDAYAAPSSDMNYVQEETVLEEGITNDNDLYFAPATQRESRFTYFDGLGRQTQQVLRRKSTLQHDVVVPIMYNDLGRVEKEYLPYVTSSTSGQYHNTAVDDQQDFYLSPPEKVTNTDYPYSIKKYEASSLGRVLQQGAPGLEWQPEIGHPTKYEYSFNNSDEIRRWRVDASTKQPVTDEFYDAAELSLLVTIDANSLAVREYTNKEGLLVLKRIHGEGNWFDTYYIYDELNLLRYVIQPEGVVQLTGNPDQAFLDKWTFQYRYDERKRLVEKKVPGADWVYMVYDDLDRLVLTQDGNQRPNNRWTFNKYDVYDRVVVTGIYTFTNPADPTQIISREGIVTKIDPSALSEQYNGNTSFHGYSNGAFPDDNLTVLTVTYYDNYDFANAVFSNEYAYVPTALAGLPDQYFAAVKGQVTGQMVRVVDTDTWIKSITWYNKRYQAVQTLSSNTMGGKDRESRQVDFTGRVRIRLVEHSNGSATTTIRETFSYDHNGNLTAHYHKIGDTEALLKEQHYNELGQLVEKNMHRRYNGLPEQSVDYRYNIRGWLTHINNASLTADGATNDDGADYFGMELHYNSSSVTNAPVQFNGNISEMLWKSAGGPSQAYGFDYDNIGRLKHARYFNLDDPLQNDAFNEQITAYDLNGNIRFLQRNGKIADGVYGPIDHLQYAYNGNTLLAVTEQQTNIAAGFDDVNTIGDDYVYDVNGNMKEDRNKGITIQYNHLNLPSKVGKVSGDNLTYGYLASGAKVYQASVEAGVSKHTDYAGQFIYENNTLKYVLHDEGRAISKSGGWEYQYFIKDHLGNVRVTFTSGWESESVTATMEASNAPEEQGQFLGYDVASKVNASVFDHTGQTDTRSALRLSGPHDVSLARTLSVMPGDTIKLEVFGKYVEESKENWRGALNSVILAATSAGSAGPPTDNIVTAVSRSAAVPFSQLLASDKEENKGVRAYLNYVVLNKDFRFVNGGYINLSENAKENGSNVAHEQLMQQIVIDQPGYVYAYLSNEQSGQTAYFDDFRISHVHSGIIQVEDYYPFGLTFNSYTRENSTAQNLRFQGQEHIEDLDLGWDSFKWRNHMPEIGRFFNIDPLAEKFYHNSPYAFSENKVASHFELEGLESVSVHVKTFAPFDWFGRGGWKGDGTNRTFSADPASPYRTGGFINYDVNQGVTGFAAYAPGESHTRWGATALSESSLNVKNETLRNLSFHSFGDNDALIPGLEGLGFGLSPTSDIDVSGNLNFNVSDLADGNKLLQIFGSVWGDGFPSAELFVTQPDGKNGVFLGTSPAHYGADFGPFFGLIGSGVIPMMGVNTSLVIDADNNILGVRHGDQTISPEEWNKQFHDKPVTDQ